MDCYREVNLIGVFVRHENQIFDAFIFILIYPYLKVKWTPYVV